MRSTDIVALILLFAAIASGTLVALYQPASAPVTFTGKDTVSTSPADTTYENYGYAEEVDTSNIAASESRPIAPSVKREMDKQKDYEPEKEYLKERSYHAYLAIPFFLLMAAIAIYFGNRKKKKS